MSDDTAAIIGTVFSIFFALGWVTWVVATNIRRHKTARVQAELQSKLLERFGSGRELLEYLQSEAGQSFLQSATIERANTFGRILGSIQVGLILFLVGLAFLLMRAKLPDQSGAFIILGSTALAVGTGFLLSAAVSYALSKSWGLLERRTSAQR